MSFIIKISVIVSVLSAIIIFPFYYYGINAQQTFRQREFVQTDNKPFVADPNLKVEVVAEGLDTPTTMAFLGPNNFLVLEKDKGTVLRMINGIISDKPLLDVNVANSVERGMCGIAVSKNASTTFVFLYYTEINGKDYDDRKGLQPEANRLYRYELVNNKLTNLSFF
jgi:glucose/arabinose dehydrogenase